MDRNESLTLQVSELWPASPDPGFLHGSCGMMRRRLPGENPKNRSGHSLLSPVTAAYLSLHCHCRHRCVRLVLQSEVCSHSLLSSFSKFLPRATPAHLLPVSLTISVNFHMGPLLYRIVRGSTLNPMNLKHCEGMQTGRYTGDAGDIWDLF